MDLTLQTALPVAVAVAATVDPTAVAVAHKATRN